MMTVDPLSSQRTVKPARSASQLPRRLVQLYAGLMLYGVSMSLILLSRLGNIPWDVLHQGLARHTPFATGTWVIIVGAAVLLLWIPLRLRPGLGTISNVIVLGIVVDVILACVLPPGSLAARIALLLCGIVANGVATGLYIGADFGPGPRDGLMVGLAARGLSLRAVRTAIEITVVVIGALLGGTVGPGTLMYAVTIGPLAHVFVPYFTVGRRTQDSMLPADHVVELH
jgi:uncharacterized membrane protein YczE